MTFCLVSSSEERMASQKSVNVIGIISCENCNVIQTNPQGG